LFSGVVIAWGLSGILFSRVWLVHVFGVPLDSFDAPARTALLADLRFLQARELGVGIFTVALRREILSDRRIRRAFLLVVAASPLARLVALAVDGPPPWLSCAFLASEASMAIVLAILTRPTREPSDSVPT
jgi:hypothetical protein